MRADHEKNSGRRSIISIARDTANTARGRERESPRTEIEQAGVLTSSSSYYARTIGSFMRFYKHPSRERESRIRCIFRGPVDSFENGSRLS